jgi:hypothetical protein
MNECSVHVPSVKNSPRVLANSNARKDRERRISVSSEDAEVAIAAEPAEEQASSSWRSCCFELDKRFVVFMSQLLISLLIMTFSMYQLSGEHGTCEGSAPYLALISTTVGYWLPQPKM